MEMGNENTFRSGGMPPAPKPRPVSPPAVPRPAGPGTGSGEFGGLRVSLMPSETEGGRRPDLQRGLLILALVLIVETIIIGGINFWLIRDTAKRQAERSDIDRQISETQKAVEDQVKSLTELAMLDRQIRAVKDSLDQHVYWTEFFTFLENNSQPNVRFLRFNGESETGIFTVDLMGKTYRDIAEQIVMLRDNPQVVSVRATAASARTNPAGEIEGVSTSMLVKAASSVWSRTPAKTTP